MKLSFVIGTRNRDCFLKHAIHSLLTQSIQNFEIIVVNYGGTKKTKQLCDSFKSRRIKYFFTNETGPFNESKAKNIGLKQSRGRIVCFTNADILFPEKATEFINNFFKTNKGKVLQIQRADILNREKWNTVYLSQNPKSRLKRLFKQLWPYDDWKKFLYPKNRLHEIKRYLIRPLPSDYAGDCLCAPKKDLVLEAGFNELIEGWGAMDVELKNRLVERGKELHFETKLNVFHIPHETSLRAPTSKLQLLGMDSEYYKRIKRVWREKAKQSTKENNYRHWGNIKV